MTKEEDTQKELVWKMYMEIGEAERHFNQLQHQYRLLASTWLLATFVGMGYVASSLGETSEDLHWLVSNRGLLIALIAVCGAAGITLLWLIDIKIYHQLLDSFFVHGLKLEAEHKWLPQIRTTARATQGGRGVLGYVVWFYVVSIVILLMFAGAFSATWLYRQFRNPDTIFDELAIWVGFLYLLLELWRWSLATG